MQGGYRLKVIGDNNAIDSNCSEVYGNGNTVSATSVTVRGNGNTVTGAFANVEGNHNTVSGSIARVVGHNNRVSGTYAKVRGNNNAVSGGNVTVEGSNNNVSGDYSSVRGNNNVVGGSNVSARGNSNRITGECAHVRGGTNNTVNGLAPEVARQQEQQRLHQQIQSSLQEARNNLLSTWRPLNQPLHSTNHNGAVQIGQRQQLLSRGQVQQQIQLNLRGQDERSDENGDACMLCLDNKAVVASFCCGKQAVCVGCARDLYQGKLVGDEACLNCRGTVSNVARIS